MILVFPCHIYDVAQCCGLDSNDVVILDLFRGFAWLVLYNEDSECKQHTTRAKKNMRKVRSYAQRLYIKQILIIFFSYKALEKCIFFPFKKLNLTIHTPKQSKELSKTQG